MNLEKLKQGLKSGNIQKIKDVLYFLLDNPIYDDELVGLVASFLIAKDRGVRNLSIDCLMNIPDEFKTAASKHIAPLVASDDIEFRNIASDILVRYNEICYDYLRPFLTHPSSDVRQFVLDIWGNIGSPKDWAIVAKMLDDTNKNVVISAIIALGNIKIPDVVDLLIEKYNQDDEYKPFVLNSLGKIGGNNSLNFLRNIIKTEMDPLLQIAAIEAFSFIEADEGFVDELLKKLPTIDKAMQPYFLKSICNVAKKTCAKRLIPSELRPIALESLKEDDIEIRKAALIALGSSYEPLDVDFLILEAMRLEPETLEIIINNIMHNSDDNILADFIEKIVFSKDEAEIFPMLLEIFYRDWETISISKRMTLMSTILSLIDDMPESILNDFCDMFVFHDRELFAETIQKVKTDSIFANKEKLERIAQQYDLIN